jgi:hypothetical protein
MNAMDTVETARKGAKIDRTPRPNAVTLAAAREARDIMSGKIQVEWNHPPATKEELKAKLKDMVEEE